MPVTILTEEDYKSSTITMVTPFNTTINTRIVASYIPVIHLYDANGKRIKLNPGTRDGVNFFGYNNIIITSCYKNIRRGIRTGAMNNMICTDLQLMDKNIHMKMSDTIITSVGTCGYESGKLAFNSMIKHLNMLKNNIDYFQSLPTSERESVYQWISEHCISNCKLKRLSEIQYSQNINIRALCILLVYIDDFEPDEVDKFMAKIKHFSVMPNIFEGELHNVEPKIYNSVYHIKICDDKKRLALHKMAPYLSDKGVSVEFHNWTSEGVNICFPIENNKELNSQKKIYKHRFTVHERSSMRQCSPAVKEESYKYYRGVMLLIKEFIDNGQIYNGFKKYISEEPITIQI